MKTKIEKSRGYAHIHFSKTENSANSGIQLCISKDILTEFPGDISMKTRLNIEITSVSKAIELRFGPDLIRASTENVKITTTHCSWLQAKIPIIRITKDNNKLSLQLL